MSWQESQERIASLELIATLTTHLIAAKRREMSTRPSSSSCDPASISRLTRTLILDTGVRTGKTHLAYSLCDDKTHIITLTDGDCARAPSNLRGKVHTLREVLRNAQLLSGADTLLIDNAAMMPRINIDSMYRLAVRINPNMFFVFLEAPYLLTSA